MFLGDLYLGFHSTMFFTYISLAVAVILGLYIKHFKFTEILVTGLTSSICFFLITNFGAWLTLEMYEKNLAGLFQSYVLSYSTDELNISGMPVRGRSSNTMLR